MTDELLSAIDSAIQSASLVAPPENEDWSKLLCALNLARVADNPLPLIATAALIENELTGSVHITGPALAKAVKQ